MCDLAQAHHFENSCVNSPKTLTLWAGLFGILMSLCWQSSGYWVLQAKRHLVKFITPATRNFESKAAALHCTTSSLRLATLSSVSGLQQVLRFVVDCNTVISLFGGVPLVLLEMERLCLLNMQRYIADFTVERPLDYQLRTEEEGHFHNEFYFFLIFFLYFF